MGLNDKRGKSIYEQKKDKIIAISLSCIVIVLGLLGIIGVINANIADIIIIPILGVLCFINGVNIYKNHKIAGVFLICCSVFAFLGLLFILVLKIMTVMLAR